MVDRQIALILSFAKRNDSFMSVVNLYLRSIKSKASWTIEGGVPWHLSVVLYSILFLTLWYLDPGGDGVSFRTASASHAGTA